MQWHYLFINLLHTSLLLVLASTNKQGCSLGIVQTVSNLGNVRSFLAFQANVTVSH